MSGCTGAWKVNSRDDYKKFLTSYEKVLQGFPGFVSITPTGSYNSNLDKQEFGDIDLITYIESDKDKATVKKELASFLEQLPITTIRPFTFRKYVGKRHLNTGEIITVRYHDDALGYSVQIDNNVTLTEEEGNFKKRFLDLPADKQGLILGLVKVAAVEQGGIPSDNPDEEYEYNLSSIELQLRKVTYEPGTYKQIKREIIWTSNRFKDVERLLHKYNLETSFDDLITQVKSGLLHERSSKRILGVFNSMITIKSGEYGTQKGRDKETAINKMKDAFG